MLSLMRPMTWKSRCSSRRSTDKETKSGEGKQCAQDQGVKTALSWPVVLKGETMPTAAPRGHSGCCNDYGALLASSWGEGPEVFNVL